MVLNPHVQDKAQKEIDEVLGPATLPAMSDQNRLPYVKNLISEVLRWRPVVPSGALTRPRYESRRTFHLTMAGGPW